MAYTKEQREAKKQEHETLVVKDVTPPSPSNESLENAVEKITPKRIKKKEIPLNTMVPCKSNVYGGLVYVSVKTNERHEWDDYGDVEYIELSELITMKNSQRSFFTKNWILIEDIEILKFLGVEKMYEKAINCESIDQMFHASHAEIKKQINGMSEGMKNTVICRARENIAEGKLDSISTIKLLEELLEAELIEH